MADIIDFNAFAAQRAQAISSADAWADGNAQGRAEAERLVAAARLHGEIFELFVALRACVDPERLDGRVVGLLQTVAERATVG